MVRGDSVQHMTQIAFIGDQVVFKDGDRPSDCCCEPGEPCCPCDGNLPDESCELQSITVSVSFSQLGSCFPDGVAATFSIAEADNDWRGTGSWNKRHTVPTASGSVNFDAALTCEGGVGPQGQNCWAIQLVVGGVGCAMCSGATNAIYYVLRLPGFDQEGVCCPIGRNASLPPVPFCNDVAGATLEVTCVY